MRRAAARAARRRGSSTTIRRLASHGSSRSRSGTRVVFPAPGGATRTADLFSARARRSSSIVSSTGRSVRGIRSAESGSASECSWITGGRNGRRRPGGRRGDRLGHGAPFDRGPSLSGRGHRAIGANEDECGEVLEGESAHCRAIRVREDEELLRQRSEELADFVGPSSHDQAGSCSRSTEGSQDTRSGVEDPRTLVRERIEDDGCEMKCRQPFAERSRALVVGSLEHWFEHQFSRRIGDHDVNGSGWPLLADSLPLE